jgi:hypothetical protein
MTDSVTIAILFALAFSAAAAALHQATAPCRDFETAHIECPDTHRREGWQRLRLSGSDTWSFVCVCKEGAQ